jgi:hypothetical protein
MAAKAGKPDADRPNWMMQKSELNASELDEKQSAA